MHNIFLPGRKPIPGPIWRFFLNIGRSLSRYCEQRGKIMPTYREHPGLDVVMIAAAVPD